MIKKASLSLSVDAIVILILAIVMLGLGLGFIRGMFGKVSAQVEQQVSAEPEPHIPTSSNVITLSRESVITHVGDGEVMKVSVFNPANETWTSMKPAVYCADSTGNNLIANQAANAKKIDQGKFVTFDIILTIPSSPPNTYLCQMGLEDNSGKKRYEKDFTIKIIE